MNTGIKQRLLSYLDFHKIIPKIILMIGFFIATLAIYTLGVYLQNRKSQQVFHRVEQVRIPVRAAVNEMLIGTNRLATAQRGYFMSGDAKYKKERLEIWQNTIEKPLQSLDTFRKDISAEDQSRIDQIVKKLNDYKHIQDELETYYDENILPLHMRIQEAMASDSMSKLPLEDLVTKEKLDKEIHELISSKSRALRQEFQVLLQSIKDSQEDALHADTADINYEIMYTNSFAVGTLIIASLIWFVLGYFIDKSLRKSIQKPVDMLQKLQAGELSDAVPESKDELNTVIVAGNKVIENLRNASSFAREIGEGKFDHTYKALGQQDVLGNSLVQMRDKLLQVAEEDQKRNWITQGLAELGEILRKTDHSSTNFYHEILSYLVKYVHANQGGLFVTNNSVLELMGCYAFNRKKYIHKTIQPGEGLVGQAYLEKEPILLTKVPEDYLRLTSGLGDAPPRCILVIPLTLKDEVYGVLELASFTVFETYQLEFLTKICEQLASVIAAAQISGNTARLLQDSQQKAEELRAQEEEMRQNLEELSATQEELARKERQYQERIRELEEKVMELSHS
jgi:CHASE3 domain sensor protein